jgi:hypothetical protein
MCRCPHFGLTCLCYLTDMPELNIQTPYTISPNHCGGGRGILSSPHYLITAQFGHQQSRGSPNLHGTLMLPPWSYKEHAGGAGTTGIWVGTPWLRIAMIQKNEVQLPFVHWKLEEQWGAHAPSWSLEVPLPTPVGHVSRGAASEHGYLHASHLQWKVCLSIQTF